MQKYQKSLSCVREHQERKLTQQNKSILVFLRITMKRKMNNFIQFRKKDDRVDTFLWKYISETGKYDNLGKIFKLLLILFQAQVKHGFSVNSNILVENLHEHSLIAQRLVNDYMRSQNLQPYELPMAKKVLTNVKNARSRWKVLH